MINSEIRNLKSKMAPNPDPRTPRQDFPKSVRVRKAADFERVYASGAYAADGVLVVNGTWNELPTTRLGLAVSRKVGPAVVRNRWKRLIREAFRKLREEMPTGLDLVVRPKRGALAEFGAIAASLPRLAAQLARRLKRADRESREP
jgi:ribonuclease P protein component